MIEFQSRPRQELTVTARQEAQRLASKLNIKKGKWKETIWLLSTVLIYSLLAQTMQLSHVVLLTVDPSHVVVNAKHASTALPTCPSCALTTSTITSWSRLGNMPCSVLL
jgi:hypothetical protein